MITQSANWVNQSGNGYAINTGFNDESLMRIELLQLEIKNKFPALIWPTPSDALHISLMDMVSPFIDYERDKNEIFLELFRRHDNILQGIFRYEKRFYIKASEIEVTPAAIIIVWEDDGHFNKLRGKFLENTAPFPGTKQPPDITFTTIARYRKDGADLAELEKFLAGKNIDVIEKVNTFRLVREKV